MIVNLRGYLNSIQFPPDVVEVNSVLLHAVGLMFLCT